MRYFVYINLSGFYVDALRKADPASPPIIVHRNRLVLDAEAGSGAKAGMTLNEARSLAHGSRFVLFEEEPFRESQRAWLDACTLVSEIVEPETLHSAFVDLSAHPDPVDVHERLVRDLSRETGLTINTGAADTKWIARLKSELVGVPFESTPVDRLPVSAAATQRLLFLGYPTIGSVQQLTLETLRAQFGDEALPIYQSCRGGVFQPVEATYPPGAILAHRRFDSPLIDAATRDLNVAYLARKLSRQLIETDRQGRTLELLLEDEEGNRERLMRRFGKPMQSARSVEVALALLLGKANKPLSAIYARMPDLEAAPRFQKELDGGATTAERNNLVDAAFSHIRTVFGDGAIQVAAQIVQPRRTAVLRAWKDATGWA